MTSEAFRNLDENPPETAARVAPPLWRLVSRRTSAITPFNEVGDGPALYCVHPISGDVTSFYDLARSLGPQQRIYGIQIPKQKMNRAFATSVEAVAQHHVEALVAFQPKGSLLLAGWSAGAIIALEMAQQLRALGRDVPLLIALDGAPCNTGTGISRWNPLYAWKLVCNLPGWIRCEIQQSPSSRALVRHFFRKFVFRARMAMPALRSEQTLHGGAVQSLLDNNGWLSSQMDFMRAMYDAMRAYIPEPYIGRVVVYEARTQPLDHLLQVGAAWTKIAKSAEIVLLAGNHASIFQAPAVDVLTRDLRMRLASLQLSVGFHADGEDGMTRPGPSGPMS